MSRRKIKARKPNTLVSIVIPVHRRLDLLQECVAAIPESAGDVSYHITIVDNGTPTEERKQVYPEYKKRQDITVLEHSQALGFPKACNIGAKRAKSPLILFLNDDVILDPGAIDVLVRRMDDPEVGIVGMLLRFPTDHKDLNPNIRPAGTVQHAGLATNIKGSIIHSYLGWPVDHPKVLKQNIVIAVTGAALMIRRSLWIKIGGFDEAYGLGTYEDVSLCFEVQELGYNVVVAPEATGIHYTGATAETYKMQYPLNQNYLVFLQKWASKMRYSEWESW